MVTVQKRYTDYHLNAREQTAAGGETSLHRLPWR